MFSALLAVSLIPMPQHVEWTGGFCPTNAPVVEVSDATQPREGYGLDVRADGVTIRSSHAAGAFYARQTLKQLTEPRGIACCRITDAPAYPWRGVLVDEGRHFQGKETIKKVLDLMAQHKLNTFHWHLTEDQGWRIDVPGLPELVRYGSVRAESPCHGATLKKLAPFTYASSRMNGEKYGPFYYTRRDLEEVVAYARERFIDVVPEIEMPGHSKGVLAAYPHLACFPENIKVRMADSDWGITPDVLCIGNEESVRLLEKVFDYVCEVFPSKVIHVGGDECPSIRWAKCPKCRAFMARQGLKEPEELQRWITRHIADYLAKKGRRIMGWDEILNGGMLSSAIGQSWRTQLGNGAGNAIVSGGEGAKRGHDMVMTPHTECYYSCNPGVDADPFLREGGSITLRQAYSFDPSHGVEGEARKHVLGSEACLWSEYIWNCYDLDWRMWPRTCAMAEILWTNPAVRDYEAFARRAEDHRRRLIAQGVNCSPVTH